VGADITIDEGAVALAAECDAGGGMVEAGDDISELANAFRVWFYQMRTTANLVKPALNHRIIAGDHESVVKS
jgi:hypothetical protein